MMLLKQPPKSLALFLLTLLFASLPSVSAAVQQQPPEQIVIEKSWEIHRGDLPSGTPAAADRQNWAPYVFSGRPERRDADNHIIWLRVPLPQTHMQDPVLHLVSVEQSFQAFIDDTEIYQFGRVSAAAEDFFAGYRWHRIPLGENLSAAGKSLYLRIASSHRLIGVNGKVAIVSSDAFMNKIVKSSLAMLLVAGIVTSLGLLGVGAFLARRNNRTHLYFGLFAISIGIYLLFRSQVRPIVITDPIFSTRAEFALFFSSVTFFFAYVAEIFSLSKFHPLVWTWRLLLAYTITAPIMAIAGVVPLISILLPFQILGLLGISICLETIIRQMFRKNPEAFVFAGGFCAISISTALDILISAGFLLPQLKGQLVFVPWGTALLVAALGAILIGRFLALHNEVLQSRQLLTEQNGALSRLDKLKDQFLANTSHELRTPLNGIIGITESLLAGAVGPIDQLVAKNLLLISRSGRRLASLINDILDFSKLKEHRIECQTHAVALRDAVDLAIASSLSLVGHKSLVLHNFINDDIPPVEADDNRLQQILNNLIGNAIKFSAEGVISIDAETKDEKIWISVRDPGIGIPPDRQAAVFQSFEQGDASVTRQYGGTGLGLSVTKQLVELQGGSIWVESKESHGSCFTFSLPISKKSLTTDLGMVDSCERTNCLGLGTVEATSDALSPMPVVQKDSILSQMRGPQGQRPRILIVDDEPINRQVLVNHLRTHDIDLEQAESGQEALASIRVNTPDLILLDVMMPGTSGYDVCRVVRESHSKSDLPIIFLTAKNQVDNLVQGFAVGANDYLIKPFLANELIARIETQLQLTLMSRALVNSNRSLESVINWTQLVLESDSRVVAIGRMAAAIASGITGSPHCYARMFCFSPDQSTVTDSYAFYVTRSIQTSESLEIGDDLVLTGLQTLANHAPPLPLSETNAPEVITQLPQGGLLIALMAAGRVMGMVELPELAVVNLSSHSHKFLETFSHAAGAALMRLTRVDKAEKQGNSSCAA